MSLKSDFACAAVPSRIKVTRSRRRDADKLHMHDFLQLFYLKNGTCIHNVSGNAQKICAGDVSITPPMNMHCIDGTMDEYEMFGLDASSDFLKASENTSPWSFYHSCILPLCETALKKGRTFNMGRGAQVEVLRLFSDLMSMSKTTCYEELSLLRAKTIEMLSFVCAEYSKSEGSLSGNRAWENCEPMYRVFNYIHKSFCEDLRTEDIAREAMISERSLYRFFEESLDMPIHTYIRTLRLSRAKELLKETDKTICEVANDVGFTYLANFHRFFREKTGVSPNEYRDSFRK